MAHFLPLFLIPWALIVAVSTISAWRYGWGLPRPEIPSCTPSVAVIVAVKGASPDTRRFFDHLLAQDYPRYRIILGVEMAADPAFALAQSLAQRGPAGLTAVIAGPAAQCGQKVANLLAGLDLLEPQDEIVVFTDADTLPDPRWIARLVAALVDAKHQAVTGYRWMVPMDGRLITALVAAANTSIVTLPRVPYATNLCWGGTMALRQTTLEAIGIRRYWRGSISDDLQMTQALKDHGIKIFSPRQNLLLSPVSFDFKSAFDFGCRQYRIIYTHEPLLWGFAAFCLLTPAASLIFCLWLAARGDPDGYVMPALAVICGEIRFQCRRKIAKALWAGDAAGFEGRQGLIDRWLRPLWSMFHALVILSAPWSRTIRWAGKTYRVLAPQKIEIVQEKQSSS